MQLGYALGLARTEIKRNNYSKQHRADGQRAKLKYFLEVFNEFNFKGNNNIFNESMLYF